MGRLWTVEQREYQGKIIKSWQPWKDSTGPVTTKGKKISKFNATKHGMRSAENLKLAKEWKILAKSKAEKCILPRRAINYTAVDFVPDYQRGCLRPNPNLKIC